MHHGARKNVAALRTVRTIIYNMIVGVTKGYKYKMRYVYAHFPINVNLEKNNETDRMEVEIRNFLGEKLVRRVIMADGVDVEASKNVKDELQLTGNDLEKVSQSAADIQQICRVRNKDIRKVRLPLQRACATFDGCRTALPGSQTRLANTLYSSWTVSTSRSVATLSRNKRKTLFQLWRKTDQGTLLHYGLRSASMKTGRFFADQNFINDFKKKDSLFCSLNVSATPHADYSNAQQCGFELFSYLIDTETTPHKHHIPVRCTTADTRFAPDVFSCTWSLKKGSDALSFSSCSQAPYPGDICCSLSLHAEKKD